MTPLSSEIAPLVGPGAPKIPMGFALLAGILTAAAVLAVWWKIDQREQAHVVQMTDNAVRLSQVLIRQDVGNRLSALGRLAQRWTATGGTSRQAWEADANRYLLDMPGFQAIAWADGNLRVQWVAPAAGNESIQTLDLIQTDEARNSVAAAAPGNSPTLIGPFNLPQGGSGISVWAPVFKDGQYDGAIVAVLRLDSWLTNVFGDAHKANHDVRILLQDHEVYRNEPGSNAIAEGQMARNEFEDNGLKWTVLITPRDDFLSAGYADASKVVLIVGLLFSFLVTIVVYLALVARSRSLQLHDTAVQLEALFQNLPGMAYRCIGGSRGTMEFVSDGCQELSGFSRSDFEAQRVSWDDLIHPDDREFVARTVKRAFAAGEAFEIEYRIVTQDKQERWVWERGREVSIEARDEKRVEGFVSDITRQRAAEAEARQQREQLAHMDRLDLLGEMASGIAHEINQPLTAISLFAQAGQRLFNAEKFDQLPDVFDKLSQHSQRAGAIIERMQAMARRQESKREVVDCNELVEDVAKLAEAEARIRDMTIEIETRSNLPAVEVDPVQIQQVALNLLRNGMEAMRSVDSSDSNVVRLRTGLSADGEIEVAVVDRGCAVSAEVAKMLFTPFSTTKESGMGMGLSISRAIITAHGGHLDFVNNEFGGATFFFTLPAAQQED